MRNCHTNLPLVECFWWAMLEGIEDKAFEQLLVGDSDLDRMACRAVFPVPCLHKRNILGTTTTPRTKIKWSWSPKQTNAISSVVSVERCVCQEWFNIVW